MHTMVPRALRAFRGRRRGARGGDEADSPSAPRAPLRRPFPPPVSVAPEARVLDLFLARARYVMFETYAGIPMHKFPEDLRVYEHLLWEARVEVVLELGVQNGGSSLWFRDRLRTLAAYGRIRRPRVIGVDTDLSRAREEIPQMDPTYAEDVTLIEGDLLDQALVDQVTRLVAPGTSCLVIEDAAHTYETTMAALRGFSGLVQPGGYYVVEDGAVDIEDMRAHPDWPRGALLALREWLGTPQGQAFRQRRDLEMYGITANPEGFLQRAS